MSTGYAAREPSIGRAYQAVPPPDALAAWTDPLILARKGRLILLCSGAPDVRACAEFYRLYYADTCFDPVPSLQSAWAAVCAAYPDMRQQLLLVVMLQGLDMLALGTAEAALYLVRDEEMRVLLGAHAEMPHARRVTATGGALFALQRRLGIDDALVLTTRRAAERLRPRALQRALAARNAPDHAAALIAHAAGKIASSTHEPVTVIRIPGFMPVPEFSGALAPVAPPPPKARHRASAGLSPIGVALLVAAVAVAAALLIERPTISWRAWEDLALRFLTPEVTPGREPAGQGAPETSTPGQMSPAPAAATGDAAASEGAPQAPGSAAPTSAITATATPSPTATRSARQKTQTAAAAPTPTPEVAVPSPTARNYPVPQLLSPREGQGVHEEVVVLRWSWSGALGEDEYFDVRMWREGAAKSSIAWTKKLEYEERYAQDGWYHWTIVVVRGKDGVIERELSREPQMQSFQFYGPGEKATPEPTLARPTRVNP